MIEFDSEPTPHAVALRLGVAGARLQGYDGATVLDRIQIDPEVCGRKPTIRGLRFTVDFVLKLLGDGYTAAEIVRDYPELEPEDVYQAARYGAWLGNERTMILPAVAPSL